MRSVSRIHEESPDIIRASACFPRFMYVMMSHTLRFLLPTDCQVMSPKAADPMALGTLWTGGNGVTIPIVPGMT